MDCHPVCIDEVPRDGIIDEDENIYCATVCLFAKVEIFTDKALNANKSVQC